MTQGKLVPQDKVLEYVKHRGIVTPYEVAGALACHVSTAFRKLDGLAYQGKLMQDDYDDQGSRMPQYKRRFAVNEEA